MQKKLKRRSAIGQCTLPNIPPVLQRVYAARGVNNEDELDYALRQLAPPELKGLGDAVALLVCALEEEQHILVVGDFDADGATSTAVAVRSLKMLGHDHVDYLVPNRFDYGYGLTPEIVDVAAAMKPYLIVTVDNGIASLEGVKKAKALGIEVLVTDHHLPGRALPEAGAIVNPNQPDCPFVSKNAAGVGVIFYVMLALRGALRKTQWFNDQRPEPNLAAVLDLVALGTVADVVPLDYNNRLMVTQGLQRMRAGGLLRGY